MRHDSLPLECEARARAAVVIECAEEGVNSQASPFKQAGVQGISQLADQWVWIRAFKPVNTPADPVLLPLPRDFWRPCLPRPAKGET